MQLSPHFTLAEITKSQIAIRRGIQNVPNEAQVENLRCLAANILEPVRAHYGRPFSPSSGFRSQALNTALGSKSTSQHTRGEAVDFEVPGIPNREIAEWIRDNLIYDKLILEFHDPKQAGSGWVHVSFTKAFNRRRVLTINEDGIWAKLL